MQPSGPPNGSSMMAWVYHRPAWSEPGGGRSPISKVELVPSVADWSVTPARPPSRPLGKPGAPILPATPRNDPKAARSPVG